MSRMSRVSLVTKRDNVPKCPACPGVQHPPLLATIEAHDAARSFAIIEAELARLRAMLEPPALGENMTSVKVAAHRARLSEKTVARWCAKFGCGTKVGRTWRVSVPALLEQRRIGEDRC